MVDKSGTVTCATGPSCSTSAWAGPTPAPGSCCWSPTSTCGSSPTTACCCATSRSTRRRTTRPEDGPRTPVRPRVVRDVSRQLSGMSRDTTGAEGVGFEPTVTCATTVFETVDGGRAGGSLSGKSPGQRPCGWAKSRSLGEPYTPFAPHDEYGMPANPGHQWLRVALPGRPRCARSVIYNPWCRPSISSHYCLVFR